MPTETVRSTQHSPKRENDMTSSSSVQCTSDTPPDRDAEFFHLLSQLHEDMAAACCSQLDQQALNALSDKFERLRCFGGSLVAAQPHLEQQVDQQMQLMARSHDEVCDLLRRTKAIDRRNYQAGVMYSLLQLRAWLSLVEYKLESLDACALYEGLLADELERQLQDRDMLQKEIEENGHLLFKIAQKELQASDDSPARLERLLQCLQRRWHAVWLKSLEMIYRLEELAKNEIMCASGISDSVEFQPSSMKRFRVGESSLSLQLSVEEEMGCFDVGYSSGTSARSMHTTESADDVLDEANNALRRNSTCRPATAKTPCTNKLLIAAQPSSGHSMVNDVAQSWAEEFVVCSAPSNGQQSIMTNGNDNDDHVDDDDLLLSLAGDRENCDQTVLERLHSLSRLHKWKSSLSNGSRCPAVGVRKDQPFLASCVINHSTPDLRTMERERLEKNWHSANGDLRWASRFADVAGGQPSFAQFTISLRERLEQVRRLVGHLNTTDGAGHSQAAICRAVSAFIFLFSSRLSDFDFVLLRNDDSVRCVIGTLDEWLQLLRGYRCNQSASSLSAWGNLHYPVQMAISETVDIAGYLLRLLTGDDESLKRCGLRTDAAAVATDDNVVALKRLLFNAELLRKHFQHPVANGRCQPLERVDESVVEVEHPRFGKLMWRTLLAMLPLQACFVLFAWLGFYALQATQCSGARQQSDWGLGLDYVSGPPPT